MSCWCEHNEIESVAGLLPETAQTRRYPTGVRAMQEAEGRVAQEGHYERAGAVVNQAGIRAEHDVLAPMQPVLDSPIPALEGQHVAGVLTSGIDW